MAIDNQEIRRTIQSLLPGTRYATRVRAFNELGQHSDWSEALEFIADSAAGASYDLVAPAAPTVQPQVNALTIIMGYNETNDGIVQYLIEHSSDNISFSQIATSPIGIYIHQVSPGQTHYYRFKVKDVYGRVSPVSPSNSGQAVRATTFKPYATVVVAAENSVAEGSENADYVCDGIDDDVTLNMAAQDGGKIILLEGDYYLSNPIEYDIGVLEGQGEEKTYLHISADITTGALFTCDSLSDLTINADYSSALARRFRLSYSYLGIQVRSYIHSVNVYLLDPESNLFNFSDRTMASHVYVEGGNIAIESGDTCTILNSQFYSQTEAAIRTYYGNQVLGCYFDSTQVHTISENSNFNGCAFSGALLDLRTKNIVSGNYFEYGDQFNRAILSVDESIISSNKFNSCYIEDVSAAASVQANFFKLLSSNRAIHVKVPGSAQNGNFSNNTVIHNSSVGSPGIPPIRIDNSVTGYLVSGNVISVYSVTGAFSDAGTNTSYGVGNYVNRVWVGENFIQIRNGGQELVHNHGNTGSTETIDLANGNVHVVTQDQACTYTFATPSSSIRSCSFTLIITAVTGAATWPASVNWTDGIVPSLSGRCVLTFITINGGTDWDGFIAGRAMV